MFLWVLCHAVPACKGHSQSPLHQNRNSAELTVICINLSTYQPFLPTRGVISKDLVTRNLTAHSSWQLLESSR